MITINDVKLSDTVAAIKDKIHKKERIPPINQRLATGTKSDLQDLVTEVSALTPHFFVRLILLIIAIPQYNSDYNIGIESTLYLSYRFVATEGRIQIHVEMTLAGERESRCKLFYNGPLYQTMDDS